MVLGAAPVLLLASTLQTDVWCRLRSQTSFARTPSGRDAEFVRSYRSLRAHAGDKTPGLTDGWFHGYDVSINAQNPSIWGSLTISYPNGGADVFSPELSSGLPTNNFFEPKAAPYNVTGTPILGQTGKWSLIVIRYRNETKWEFEPSASNPNNYVWKRIKDVNGRFLTINRDSANSDRVTTVQNDRAPTPDTLLSFVYSGSYLDRVEDNLHGKKVELTTGTLSGFTVLSEVSHQALISDNPSKKWQYTYQIKSGRPVIKNVTVSAADGGADASNEVATDSFSLRATKLTDGNGNTRDYTPGTFATTVTVKDSLGAVVQSWTQRYNGNGLDAGITDVLGHSSTVLYEDLDNPYQPSKVINRNSKSFEFTYDTDHGGVKTFQEPTAGVPTCS